MSRELEQRSVHDCFGGQVTFYSHVSRETKTKMNFSIFLPPSTNQASVPGLIYLAGLTCTEETFMIKAGAQRYAALKGIALICPDTSPRDADIRGEDDDWDFGTGAGFYLDAEASPWSENYRMYSYVTKEIIEILDLTFPIDTQRLGIFGHSMGGHGALTIHLKNPSLFKTVSAFAPICAPMKCPWGQKAFANYLGSDERRWRDYDACELVKLNPSGPGILIDQGLADNFLETELQPHLFESACRDVDRNLLLRRHEGYDHGYYFIASFVEDHINHHSKGLCHE
ncbi:MAG: S-formylglutathione hydrolase [Rhodospirillaceae bacterium]|mgnify:CR=1 FL=1|nr:S-formylglutathione hydrolase [Rhodospirillaceae bacterium]|tara:strand:- start:283 stop:1134 length:852 start_codon:yes stop_codon:yes gene_type:complete